MSAFQVRRGKPLHTAIHIRCFWSFCFLCLRYFLFGRILYKLAIGKSSHEAGRDYEGDSESEDEGADDDDAKHTKSH